MKLLTKINILNILKEHIDTLRNYSTGKLGFDDLFTFIILPLIGTFLLLCNNILINDKAVNIIITTLSILVGLLFNVIVIIFDIVKRDSSKKIKNDLLKELLTNISFSIILAISIIILSILTYVHTEKIKIFVIAIVYFLLLNYFTTVLMIVKRMYKLFTNEINEITNAK